MSTASTPAPLPAKTSHELGHLRPHWWFLLIVGILLVVGGTTAIVYPLVASRAFVAILSAILMIAGVATIVAAFRAGKWSGFLVHLLVGILYLARSLVATQRPW